MLSEKFSQFKKKGMVISPLMALIILVAIIFVFLPSVGNTYEKAANAIKVRECALSVSYGDTSDKCPYYLMTFGKTKPPLRNDLVVTATIDPKDPSDEKSNAKHIELSLDKNLPRQSAVAQLLTLCNQMGGGPNSGAFSRNVLFGEKSMCINCFHFTPDETITNLAEYLKKHSPQGTKKPYLELLSLRNLDVYEQEKSRQRDSRAYLEFGKEIGSTNLFPSSASNKLEAGTEYRVFFIGIKNSHISNIGQKLGHFVNGDWVRAFLSNQDVYYTFIAEPKYANELCEHPVN